MGIIEGGLLKVISKYWGKKKSILPALALIILLDFVVVFLLDSSTFRSFSFNKIHYIYISIFCFILWLAYSFFCLKCDHLPSAPVGTLAVLFVIDAETPQLINEVTFKLVGAFETIPSSIDSAPIQAICVSKNQLKKYSFNNRDMSIQLLQDTNCIFLVDVRYSVDSTSQAENYEIQTNYAVRHPRFKDEAMLAFSQDINALGRIVGRQRFNRTQMFDAFNFTAQSLSLICQYLTCFIYLLSGNAAEACSPLQQLEDKLNSDFQAIPIASTLKPLVLDRLFVAYIQLSFESINRFEETKESAYLILSQDYLKKADSIYPDTYVYNINMAYIYVAKEKDYAHAKQCIDKCKRSKHDNSWMYSEAFLYAYAGKDAGSIISKYSQAASSSYNLVRIADYIEYVIDQEPERMSLHLAAALVYESLGDFRQMKRHLVQYPMPNPKISALIKMKIASHPCDISCDNNCKLCQSNITA